METQKTYDAESAVFEALAKTKKDFLTIPQLTKALPSAFRKQLGLTGKSGSADVVRKLKPLVGDRTELVKKGRSHYLVKKIPVTQIIFTHLGKKTELSPGQLGKNLPMKRDVFVAALNSLIAAGQVECRLKNVQNYTAMLRVASGKEPVVTDDRAALRGAYQTIGTGRGFVRIHRLRELLGWSRERFDRLLMDLMDDYTVQLHGGDPSTMTEEEIKNSFMDENNILYITMSWQET